MEEVIKSLLDCRLNTIPQIGDKYNRLTFTGAFVATKNSPANTNAHRLSGEFSCECGGKKVIELNAVMRGLTKSCGCVHKERMSLAGVKRRHPNRDHRRLLYWVWRNMLSRCNDSSDAHYEDYGLRGITTHPDWSIFETFYSWSVSTGYSPGLHLERKDNDSGYCPDNCTWSTRIDQANNKRNNVFIEAFGERKTLSQWARDHRCSVKRDTLRDRLARGESPEPAMTRPLRFQ